MSAMVDTAPIVCVERLSYTYAARSRPTLDDVSFRVPRGSWTLLAGATGSGKSTLLRALAGIIPQHAAGVMQGRVLLDTRDMRELSVQQRARMAGLVLQSPDDQLCAATLGAEVAFGLENLCLPVEVIDQRVKAALKEAGLEGRPSHPGTQLSGGEKQRLLLASIVAMQPQVLLLDEPLSQLDPAAAAEFIEHVAVLQRLGMTIVMAEHRLDELLPHADGVLVLDQGRITAHVPSQRDDMPWPDLANTLQAAHLAVPELVELSTACQVPPRVTVEDWLVQSESKPFSLREKVAEGRMRGDAAPEPGIVCRVRELTCHWPHASSPLWSDVTFDLHAGESVAIVGPNGSGKSTLLRTLAGLQRPTTGSVEFTEVDNLPCGLVAQNPDLSLFCPSVREELSFGLRQQGLPNDEVRQRVAEVLAAMELESLGDEPPQALSQGQRLRTAVAALWAMRPALLLLDEPTTGQDPALVTRLMQVLRAGLTQHASPRCLLLATHDLRVVQRFTHRVLVLGGGRLLADVRPEALLADDTLLEQAQLRRPPLLEVRQRLGLRGWDVAALARELCP